MIVHVLALHMVLGSGVLAGVLVAVSRAVVPTFAALPADRYVQLHQLLDPRFDPIMPWICRIAMVQGTVLVVVVPPITAKALLALGVILIGVVALVSELRNVPINRQVLSWDPQQPPPNWTELRSRWARGHHLRTAFAVTAFATNTLAALVIS